MKKPSIDAYSDKVLKQAIERFCLDKEKVKQVHSFENYIYTYERDGKLFMLKMTHSSYYTANQIRGEVEWIGYLASNGISLARPYPSPSGNTVEVLEAEDSSERPSSYFSAVSYEKIEGQHLRQANEAVFRKWGQVIGRMHALARRYEPSDVSIRRPHWHEDDDLKAEKYLDPSQSKVIECCHEILEYARSLPTDPVVYGIVHGDLYSGNFLMSQGKFTVIDFGGCRYDWFANDLGIPLFYALRNPTWGRGDADFARLFMRCMLEGYLQENSIERYWLAEIPFFHKLREVMLYILLHAEGLEDLDPWSAAFMQGRRESIEQGTPIIDIDFTRL